MRIRPAVVLLLIALSMGVSRQAAASQGVTVRVLVPGTATVPPGGSVVFEWPEPPRSPVPPPPRRPVEIVNHSYQPATVTLGPDLLIAVPEDQLVRVEGSSVGSLGRCTPEHGRMYVVRCRFDRSRFNFEPIRLTTLPADTSIQAVLLAGNSRMTLIGPPLRGGEAEPRSLFLHNLSPFPLWAQWHGDSVTAALPGEWLPAVTVREDGGAPAFPDTGCVTVEERSNFITCPLEGAVLAEVAVDAVPVPPPLPLSLPYRDRYGDGTVTLTQIGADPAIGGVRLAVTLDQHGVRFVGDGVLRPGLRMYPQRFLLAFSLTGPAGVPYRFAGTLLRSAEATTAAGLMLADGDDAGASAWLMGDAEPSLVLEQAIRIFVLDGGLPEPRIPSEAARAAFFPALLDDLSLAMTPPNAGVAGVPVAFALVPPPPFAPLPDRTLTFRWRFGDGSPDQIGSAPGASHTYIEPGIYDVTVILTDSTGASTFGITRIRIAPP